jgi:acetyl esterase
MDLDPMEQEKAYLARPRRHWVLRLLVGAGVLAMGVYLAFQFSPRPTVWIVRAMFDKDGEQMRAELDKHAPADVALIADQPYRPGDPDALLDVYFPDRINGSAERLPVIVWTHGGGWVHGNKALVAPYYQLLASKGYVVISLDYTLAPEGKYPTPVHQINAALSYIQQNAERFHADVDRVFMAGDSAGAQLTSQVAAIIRDPAFAEECGIAPALSADRLRGVILHCGIYDLRVFHQRSKQATGVVGLASSALLWAYGGSKEPADTLLDRMSTIQHLTAAYPPVFISGGNGDPLTAHQSLPFADRARSFGVEVDAYFFEQDHSPAQGHEYQFRMDAAEARMAFERTIAFLMKHTD